MRPSPAGPGARGRRAGARGGGWALLGVVGALLTGPAHAYEVNGKHWPSMPVPYYVNVQSAPDFGDGSTAFDVVQAATEAWTGVGCADVGFQRLGDTTAVFEADGQNTIFWITDVWPFGESAAGATLWIPTEPGAPYEVDLALNAVDFEWTVGGADATVSDVVDPASVIAHELGHWLGLAHSADVHATMYQAMLPNAAQITPSGDDKLAICTLYPSGEDECANDWDCGAGYECAKSEQAAFCAELRDPVGAPCSKTHINCEDMCLISFFECSTVCAYETTDLTKGYCAPLCTGGLPCPPGWTCTAVPSVSQDVCLKGGAPPDPDPDPELTPHEDAGAWPDAAADVAAPEEVVSWDGGGEPDAPAETDGEGGGDSAPASPDASAPDAAPVDTATPQADAGAAPAPEDAAEGCAAPRGRTGASAVPGAVLLVALAFAARRRRSSPGGAPR